MKDELEELLVYVYTNGSVPYKKVRGKMVFDLIIKPETADKWIETALLDTELLRKVGDELVITDEGIEYLRRKGLIPKLRAPSLSEQ